MRILADKEGRDAIEALCDWAVRSGGLKNVPFAGHVLGSVAEMAEPDPQDEPATDAEAAEGK